MVDEEFRTVSIHVMRWGLPGAVFGGVSYVSDGCGFSTHEQDLPLFVFSKHSRPSRNERYANAMEPRMST